MICLRNVVELAKIAILSTAKSFVFFSFSFFNALVQHSRNFAIKKKQSPLSVFLLASVRLGVLEAGIFSENTETNTISGTQIIFIAKQMGGMAYLFILGIEFWRNFNFRYLGEFSSTYILGGKTWIFSIFSISMEKCVFPAKVQHIHNLFFLNSGKINSI